MIYLACPYSHPDPEVRELRFRQISVIAGAYLAAGINVYSPICHSHPIQKYAKLPATWAFWKPIDVDFLKICNRLVVVMMDGWKESVGVTGEIEEAKEFGIPIEYVYPPETYDEIEI